MSLLDRATPAEREALEHVLRAMRAAVRDNDQLAVHFDPGPGEMNVHVCPNTGGLCFDIVGEFRAAPRERIRRRR